MAQEREYPFKRNPQPLSRNFSVRSKQIEAIAANPNDQQKAAVDHAVRRIVDLHYSPSFFASGVTVKKFADRVDHGHQNSADFFINHARAVEDQKDAVGEINKIRQALFAKGATSSSIKEARERLGDAREIKREKDRLLSENDFVLRESGIKVNPEHTPLTASEKVRIHAFELQKRVIEPGLKLGRKRLQLLVESIAARLGSASQPLINSVSKQEDRLRIIQQQVKARVSGWPFLSSPAWESIQRDRENVKRQTKALGNNLVIKVEEKVLPVVYSWGQRIEENTRGKQEQMGRLRAFGKGVLGSAAGVFKALKKGWQEKFSDGILGEAGLVLGIASSIGHFKKAVRNEDAKWWLEDRGYDAKEGLIRTAEWIDRHEGQVTEAVEAVRTYWNTHAVKRWQEMGLKKKEIQDRVKLMNAIGSASLKNAVKKVKAAPYELAKGGKLAGKGMLRAGSFAGGATLAAWDGLSLVGVKGGAEAFKFLGEHKKVRMGLAVGLPIALVFLSNPHMMDNITGWLGGGLHLAAATGSGVDLAGNLPSFDAGIVSSGSYSPTVDISSINTADMGNQIVSSDPSYHIDANIDAGASNVVSAPTGSGEVTVFDSSSVNVGADTLSTSDGMNNSLSSVNIAELVTKIQPGQPVGVQIAELAKGMPGDTQENTRKLFEKIWEVDGWNFESTSRAILDGVGGTYTDTQIRFAQRAADAADLIKRDPSSATQQVYEYATHYWRPAPR